MDLIETNIEEIRFMSFHNEQVPLAHHENNNSTGDTQVCVI